MAFTHIACIPKMKMISLTVLLILKIKVYNLQYWRVPTSILLLASGCIAKCKSTAYLHNSINEVTTQSWKKAFTCIIPIPKRKSRLVESHSSHILLNHGIALFLILVMQPEKPMFSTLLLDSLLVEEYFLIMSHGEHT